MALHTADLPLGHKIKAFDMRTTEMKKLRVTRVIRVID